MQRDYITWQASYLALALGLTSFASCAGNKLSDGNAQSSKSGNSENSGGEVDTDDEKAAEPAMVSGSFLACAYETSVGVSESTITCAWTSAKDRPSAKDVSWKALGEDGNVASGVTVTPSTDEPSAKFSGETAALTKATVIAERQTASLPTAYTSGKKLTYKLGDVPSDCGSPYKRFVKKTGTCQSGHNLFRKSRLSSADYVYDVDRALAPDWRVDGPAFAIFDLVAGEDCKGPLAFLIVHQLTGPGGLHRLAGCGELEAMATEGYKPDGKIFMSASPLAFGAEPLHRFVLPSTGAHYYTLTPESDSLGGWVEEPWHVYVLPPE